MTTHTPGPWTVEGDTIQGGDGFSVCVVRDDPNADREDGAEDANRSLIAAAPDLLKGLWHAQHRTHKFSLGCDSCIRAQQALDAAESEREA